MSERRNTFDPKLLQSVKGMEWIARQILSGFRTGWHPNLLKGSGQEFSQYRSYQPGDDLRQLDWKMYARSDRFYVRESEVETQVSVQFVIDASASMLHEEEGLSKLDYARMLCAALGYLASNQGDEVSALGVNHQKVYQARLSQGRQPVMAFWQSLLLMEGAGKWPGYEAFPQWPFNPDKKTLSVFFTDLYERDEEIFSLLKQVRAQGNEVVVFQLMGPREYTFDYSKNTTFQDLETGEQVQVDPSKLRTEYREQLERFMKETKDKLMQNEIDCHFIRTDQEPADVIRMYLESRKALM